MIKSFVKLLGAASSAQIDALSRQVADLSVEDVCSAVRGQIEAMTFSEARGYVRARAARVVRKRTRQVISTQASVRPELVAEITRTATERIVPLVLRQTGVGVPTVTTKPATTKLRLAA